MSFFVIVRGPLGVGKTTIAKELTKAWRGMYIPIDDVLAKHHLDQAEESDGIPAENFFKAHDLILPDVQRAAQLGQSIIIDGCFYYQEAIDWWFNQLSIPGHVFTLTAPLDVCIERDRQRATPLGEDAARAVYELVARVTTDKKVEATRPIPEIVEFIQTSVATKADGSLL